MTIVPINTEEDLSSEMRDLVGYIMEQADNPSLWPLSDAERLYFVREVVRRAMRIRNSRPYLVGNIAKAVVEFKASERKTRPKLKRTP